jgi:hypothetical protein
VSVGGPSLSRDRWRPQSSSRLMQPQVDRRRALGFGRKIRRNEAGSLEHTHGLVRWIAAVANDDERGACLPTPQHQGAPEGFQEPPRAPFPFPPGPPDGGARACLSFVAGLRHGGRGLTRGQIAENHPSNYGKLAGGAARPSASKTPSRNRPGSRSSSLAS